MLYLNRKYTLFLLSCLLLLMATAGKAQNSNIFLQLNYGSFQMKDMEKMQNKFATEVQKDFDARIVSSFPAYVGYELNANTKIGEGYQMGGYVSYYSTGGRIHYKDYSGEFKVDQLLLNFSVGMYNEFRIRQFTKSDLFFSTRAGVTFTEYQIISNLQVGSKQNADDITFNSINFHFSPGIGFRYPFKEDFFIQADTRYEIQIPGPLHLSNNKDAKLIDDGGKELKANWDGLRLGLSFGYTF